MEAKDILEEVGICGLEMLLYACLSSWGDEKLDKSEVNFLYDFYKKNFKYFQSHGGSFPNSVELSGKEYIFDLFSFIKVLEKDTSGFNKNDISDEFNAYVKKNPELIIDDKVHILLTILDTIDDALEEQYKNNFKALKKAKKRIYKNMEKILNYNDMTVSEANLLKVLKDFDNFGQIVALKQVRSMLVFAFLFFTCFYFFPTQTMWFVDMIMGFLSSMLGMIGI